MSRIFVCFFVLCSIAVLFGDCKNAEVNCDEIIPGSDTTRLSFLESRLKKLMDMLGMDKSSFKIANSFSDLLEKFKEHIYFIFPGTKWCGAGDRAKNESDLGNSKETDACCRKHDHCNSNILAGEEKANLKNNGLYTRSAKHCDFEFYDCLKKVNSATSKSILMTYFSILQPQCFKCVCPTSGCNPDVDLTGCKDNCDKFQWIDNKEFPIWNNMIPG